MDSYIEPIHAHKRVSWSAIIAGIAVALVLQLLLSLLGIAIGASTIHPTSPDGASAQSVGTGSAVWFIVTSCISLFFGGWTSGYLAGFPRRLSCVLHGLATWAVTTLFTVYLLTTALGGIVGGATGAVGSLFSAAGSGIAAAAPHLEQSASNELAQNNITPDTITAKVQQMLNETGNPKLRAHALKAETKHQAKMAKGESEAYPNDTKQNYNDLVYRFLHDTGTGTRAQDRQSLINVVASEQHVSKAHAAEIVDSWSDQAKQAQEQSQRMLQQAQEKAKEAGDAAAAAVAKAALSGFVVFLLGGIAAAIGGLFSIRNLLDEASRVIVTPRGVI